MSKTKKKKDKDTLEVTNDLGTIVTYITRTELQTQLDHKNLDKAVIQLEIDGLNSDLDLLN